MHRTSTSHRTRRWAGLAVGLVALTGTACQPQLNPKPITTHDHDPGHHGHHHHGHHHHDSPTVTKVTCPSGSTITVSTSIAADVRDLLAAAKDDGLSLCGSGYRSTDAQVALRKINCGPTYYDIRLKPPSQCSSPTAIPGRSMHEKGLAIDFYNCSTRSTSCYKWLAVNAKDFGLKNLPSERWHWSTNGS